MERERERQSEFRRGGWGGQRVKGESAEGEKKSKWEEKEAALVRSREVDDMTDDEESATRGRGGKGVTGVGDDTRERRGSKARVGKEGEEEMESKRGEVAAGKTNGIHSQKWFLY